ncbi:MAG: hypothetical protein JXA90_04700 [Planctomycetes bacterium]|nr:hypothetical protein [Planctomycetota bacterium]
MRTTIWTILAILLLSAAPPLAAQVTQTDSALLKALPPETTLVVEAKNVAGLTEKIKASPLYRLKEKPEFSAMVKEAEENFARWRRDVQEETEVDLEKFLSAWQGDVSFVIGDVTPLLTSTVQALVNMEMPELDPASLPILLSVDAAGGKDQMASDLKKIVAAGRKKGTRIEEAPFQSGRILTVHRPENETEGPERILIGEMGSRYFISMDTRFLQGVMSRLSGGETQPSLMSHSAFQMTYKETDSGGDLFVFFNMQPIIRALDQSLGLSPYAFIWTKVKTLLLGQTLNNAGISLTIEPKGIREKVFIHNDGGEDGIMGWFKGPEIASRPPDIIPSGALSFSSASVNMSKVFGTVREIVQVVQTFSGSTTDIDTQFQQIFGLSLDDLIRNFGHQVDTFLIKGPTEENPMGDMTFVFQLGDDGPMKQMMERISMMSQGQLAAEKYLNRDVYAVPPVLPGVAPAFCVTDSRLILSMDRDNVELVIRRIGKDDPGLAESDTFQKAASSFFPSKVSGLSYTDEKYVSQAMDNIMESMKTGMPDEVPVEIFQILSAAAKSFGSQVGYGKWKDKGLYSEMWAPYR